MTSPKAQTSPQTDNIYPVHRGYRQSWFCLGFLLFDGLAVEYITESGTVSGCVQDAREFDTPFSAHMAACMAFDAKAMPEVFEVTYQRVGRVDQFTVVGLGVA